MERRQQVAAQLRGLMERHKLTPADIERVTQTPGDNRPPVSAVTVRRILKAEARTEPEPTTLRRIAEAVGERYTSAFAEEESPDTTIDIGHRAGKFHLRLLGAPAPEGLEAELRDLLDRWEKKLAKTAAKK